MFIWYTCEKKSAFKRDITVEALDRAQSEKPGLRNNTPRKRSEEENQNYSPEKLVQLTPQLLLQPKVYSQFWCIQDEDTAEVQRLTTTQAKHLCYCGVSRICPQPFQQVDAKQFI